ncbi:hypothetical protein ACFE04_016006 [Oxalis oulophora]
MAYINCGGPPEDLIQLIKERLEESKLNVALELLGEDLGMSSSSSLSAYSSSDEENDSVMGKVGGRELFFVSSLTSSQHDRRLLYQQKIEVIDKANLQYNDIVIEGDAIVGSIEKILNENKIIPTADGGSIVKSKSTFYTTDETEIPVQILTEGKEKRLRMYKATEAYLLANSEKRLGMFKATEAYLN